MKISSAEFFRTVAQLSQLPADGRPEIALAGRSNVGKSSLLNSLVNRHRLAVVSRTPGRTRNLNFYLINRQFYLVDLPGYGYASVARSEQERWSRLINAYLEERETLRGVILLVDIRHDPGELDRLMYAYLAEKELPTVVVATKADKVARGRIGGQVARIRCVLELAEAVPVVPFSALSGMGREEVWKVIRDWLEK